MMSDIFSLFIPLLMFFLYLYFVLNIGNIIEFFYSLERKNKDKLENKGENNESKRIN